MAAASCWLSVGTALREERYPACGACVGFLFVAVADDHEPSGLKHQRTTLQFRGPDVWRKSHWAKRKVWAGLGPSRHLQASCGGQSLSRGCLSSSPLMRTVMGWVPGITQDDRSISKSFIFITPAKSLLPCKLTCSQGLGIGVGHLGGHCPVHHVPLPPARRFFLVFFLEKTNYPQAKPRVPNIQGETSKGMRKTKTNRKRKSPEHSETTQEKKKGKELCSPSSWIKTNVHPWNRQKMHFLSFFLNFIYFWLHWVFVAVRGLSLVAASRGYSLLWCAGFSFLFLKRQCQVKGKHINWTSAKFRNFLHQRIPNQQWNSNSQNGRKYLQTMFLIRGLYSEYIRIPFNWATERQATQIKVRRGLE